MAQTICDFNVRGHGDIDEFRLRCMNNGNVVCDWECLKAWLESHVVSDIWWDLAPAERHSIAHHTAANTMFYYAHKTWSDTAPAEPCLCMDAALLRYTKVTSPVPGGETIYTDGICWQHDICYGIPGHYISNYTEPNPNNHAMTAIQIKANMDNIDSWYVYQWPDLDIKPGSHQMSGNHIIVRTPTKVRLIKFPQGLYMISDTVAEFWL